MRPVTRQEAIRLGLKRYFTGRPCPGGHVVERFVSTWGCVECNLVKARARYQAHPERPRAKARAWGAANPDEVRARSRAWQAAHPDRHAALVGLLHARRRFPDCVPPDFDFEATVPIYAKARGLTRETGVPHEVDHITALCLGGQHIASNLQVLTKLANRKKANTERATGPR